MTFNEATVFKWVLIVGVAVGSAIALTLLTSELVGALWGLVLALAGCAYGIRWTRDWWRRTKPPAD